MKCNFCDGNIIEFNGNYICDKCAVLYKKENDKFINISCPKCASILEDGVCKFCEKEIVIEDDEEEAILYCPECGEPLDIKGHCKACGSKIDVTFEK